MKRHWIVIGDVHDEPGLLPAIPELPSSSGLIISGDLTIKGGAAEAAAIIEAASALNKTIYAQIGNMDTLAAQAYLEESGRNIHLKALELAPGFGLLGLGWSTPTPFGTPSEVDDATLGKWLEEASSAAAKFDRLMLVSHTPPYGTCADKLGNGAHVGSQSVREFILRRKPELCITGHIHEASCEDYLGPTKVINPGMFGYGGYVLLSFDGERLEASFKKAGG